MPLFMVGVTVGMLYVAYIHVYLPAVGVHSFFASTSLGFHAIVGL